MVERGVGSYQIKKARNSVRLILDVLKDGKWHRFSEIQKATGLSTATLSKHLKMLEGKLVRKWIDVESGKIPIPVYYRLEPDIAITQGFKKFTRHRLCLFTLENRLPRLDLYIEQMFMGELLFEYLIHYSENPDKNEEEFSQAVEFFVLEDFREWIEVLKEAVKKLRKEKVNITEILKEELTHYTEEFKAFLESLVESLKQKKQIEKVLQHG